MVKLVREQYTKKELNKRKGNDYLVLLGSENLLSS